MKKLFLLCAMGLVLGANGAQAADVQVSPCSKDAKILKVQISGESAVNIFRALAQRAGLKPAAMVSTLSNGMNCEG
ncbi:MAG: hypothetical protein ACXWRE_16445, partial [Pseudobdellovibrionaceae bacterium]